VLHRPVEPARFIVMWVLASVTVAEDTVSQDLIRFRGILLVNYYRNTDGAWVVRLKFLVGFAFCACLFGCDQAALVQKFVPPGAESTARNYFDLLRQGKFDQITRDFDPSVPNSTDALAYMASLIPAETPKSVKVVSAHTFRNPEYSTISITLEYQFPSKWLLVDVTTKKAGDVSTVTGFHVGVLRDSLENLNRFTLSGKGAVQDAILTLAICALSFSFYVLSLCIREKDVKRKWLWMLFILAGVGNVAVNWRTGELTFRILSINLPCVSAGHPPYGQWTIAVFLPLGAILFLNRQRRSKIVTESIPPLDTV
jgi:hypothetical protein